MSLDATIGGADSNSYVTVVVADDFFVTRINSGDWDNLSDEDKEAALVTATLMLESYMNWYGTPTSYYNDTDPKQALHWPATGATCKGAEVADDIIPIQVQRAVCEQAVHLLRTNAINDPTEIAQGLASAGVGSVQAVFDKTMVADRIGGTVLAYVTCFGEPTNDATNTGIGNGDILRG